MPAKTQKGTQRVNQTLTMSAGIQNVSQLVMIKNVTCQQGYKRGLNLC